MSSDDTKVQRLAPRHVTVVVPVRNRRERMLRCLDAILAQDYPAFEVLVFDNGSSDGTAEAVERRASDARARVEVVRVREPDERLRVAGPAIARNQAVARARGDVIAFTDSDCAPEPGWLTAGVASLEADPLVGVVQGCTLPDGDEPLAHLAATQVIMRETRLFECCNLFYRVAAIREAGGFPEEMGFFCEDTAAGWSVIRNGWRSAFAADAVVRHDVTYPGFRWFVRRTQHYANFAALARKYPEVRRELFWHKWFLRRRNAAFAAAALGLALAPLRREALVLAFPYAWFRRPRHLELAELRGIVQGTLFDAGVFVGLVRGSVRFRALVL